MAGHYSQKLRYVIIKLMPFPKIFKVYNQKGFSSFMFILAVLLISGAVVGGSLYLKKNNFQITENINSQFVKQKVSTSNLIDFSSSQVLFTSTKNKFFEIASPDGKNIKAFSGGLLSEQEAVEGLESPDKTRLLFIVRDLNSSSSIGNGSKFFIAPIGSVQLTA